MRAGILKLLLVSLVFVSVEGVADAVDDLSFHQSHHEHADNSANEWYPDAAGDDHDPSGCEHFCHGHSVGLTGQLILAPIPQHGVFAPTPPVQVASQLKSPPTPPPDILS